MSLARRACAALPEWRALTGCTIVEGGFASALDVANRTSWRWLPLPHLITQRLDAGSRVGQVKAPRRVVHAGEDMMSTPISAARCTHAPTQRSATFLSKAKVSTKSSRRNTRPPGKSSPSCLV